MSPLGGIHRYVCALSRYLKKYLANQPHLWWEPSLSPRDKVCELVSELVYLTSLLNSQNLIDDGLGNETKDERAPDMTTPGFEPRTQWFEVECSTARPYAPREMKE